MFAAFSTVEIFGPRALQLPPRGTRSSILRHRLRGHRLHPQSHPVADTRLNSRPLSQHALAAVSNADAQYVPLGQLLAPSAVPPSLDQQAAFVQNILAQPLPEPPPPPPEILPQFAPPDAPSPDDIQGRFLFAIQQADVAALWGLLVHLVPPNTERIGPSWVAQQRTHRRRLFTQVGSRTPEAVALRQVIAGLSPNTFSQLLRCLEPEDVRRELEAAGSGLEFRIDSGMAKVTPLGMLVDEFGVRRLFVDLFRVLAEMYDIRHQAGRPMRVGDFVVVLRAAAATSNKHLVKTMWHFHVSETGHYKRPDVWTEFVKARFLTEPAYWQYDRARVRLRPLHRANRDNDGGMTALQYHRLTRMQHNKDIGRVDRFGFSPPQPSMGGTAMNEMTTLGDQLSSDRSPVPAILAAMMRRGEVLDEQMRCSFMIASSRAGALNVCNSAMSKWGLRVQQKDPNSSEHTVEVMGKVEELRRKFSRNPGVLIAPTHRLLETVVHSYCVMAELGLAIRIVDQLSRLYDIPIKDSLWFDLLEWTNLLASPPVRTEWATADRPDRVLGVEAVQQVWDLMLASGVRPGLAQYLIMAKHLIRRRDHAGALGMMEEMRAIHERRMREYEAAVLELAEASAARLPTARALRRFRAVGVRKWESWYAVQACCRAVLDETRASRSMRRRHAATLVPHLVSRFDRFLPRVVRYRVATGDVELRMDVTGVRRYALRSKKVRHPADTRGWLRRRTLRRLLERDGAGAGASGEEGAVAAELVRWTPLRINRPSVTMSVFPRVSSLYRLQTGQTGWVARAWRDVEFG